MSNASEISQNLVLTIGVTIFYNLTLLVILPMQMFDCWKRKSIPKGSKANQKTSPWSTWSSDDIDVETQTGGKEDAPTDHPLEGVYATTDTDGPETHTNISQIHPRQFERDAKQARIAMGEMRERTEYPTMADVLSDWESTVQKHPGDDETGANTDVGGQQSTQLNSTKMVSATKPPSNRPVSKIAPAGLKTGKSAAATQVTSPPDQAIVVEPSVGCFTEKGGNTVLSIINLTKDRFVYKARCTNNALYQMSPVHGFLEPNSKATLMVERQPGPVKKDRLEICYRKARPDAKDARRLFTVDPTLGAVGLVRALLRLATDSRIDGRFTEGGSYRGTSSSRYHRALLLVVVNHSQCSVARVRNEEERRPPVAIAKNFTRKLEE